MKSLYLVCWALAAYVALSQGQTTPTPCDFPEICFPPVITFPEASDLEGETISARCYSACVEDIVLKQLNLTTAMEEIMPTLPCWPTVHLPEQAREFASWCSFGCSSTLSGHQSMCPHAGCLGLQIFRGDQAYTVCNLGCQLGIQLKNDSGNPPSSPIAPPVPTSFSPVHFDFANSQPNTNQCAGNSTSPNTFVVLMSNGTTNAASMLESSADWGKPFRPFSCKYVNVSFAVVNRYGASDLSPAATMCGGGIVYPSHVRHLIVTLEDDDNKTVQFGQDVLKIKLSWEPPPEAPLATGYRVTVTSTSSDPHCPRHDATPVEFSISKDSNGINLESNYSADFKLPVSCKFHIAVESLPKIPMDLLPDWQQSTEIDVNTEFAGQEGLEFNITSAWTWNEAGFYTLQLNVTLPNVTYVRQGLRQIEISVQTSRKSTQSGVYKVPVNSSQLTYTYIIPARYPPKEGDQEYVFDIRSQHHAEYYRYRMPQAQSLTYPAPSFPPSPVQNVTVISHVVKGNILELHVTWAPPVVTNGALRRYLVYVWHLPTPDAKQSTAISDDNATTLFLSKEIIPGRPQYIMIRAENFFQASNWSTPILLNIESSPQEQGVPEGVIYGLSGIAALIAVVLVIMFVLSVMLYLQRRKHKVVFLKDTEADYKDTGVPLSAMVCKASPQTPSTD